MKARQASSSIRVGTVLEALLPALPGGAGHGAGRWKGAPTLRPAVAAGKRTGTFRSADSQAEYAAEGELKRPGKRTVLRVRGPRSDLELEGHWSPDETRFAGVARLSAQEFGFVAKRQQ